MDNLRSHLAETTAFIKDKIDWTPEVGLILGSGLGILAEEVENPVTIPYGEIPHFPVSTVQGHAGRLVLGNLEGQPVCIMQGRFHYYEGYSLAQVTYPVRVMQELGVKTLLVTNAAGGVNTDFQVGDLMIIADHINLMGSNPLIGPHEPALGPRFNDMTEAYSRELITLAEKIAAREGIWVQKGIYLALTGPSYETPAEIRMIRILGADAVGMSTVPEVIVARNGGLQVLGISCITNMAAGLANKILNHDEVTEVANQVKSKFLRLVKGIVGELETKG